ncbi:class I SAM-dependent methyltransferase [Paenibacillaceae sp. P-4]|uniref:class I SAM-dependent methyltransferase n=1 Tax=Paenibacillaceae bacterium P-4 TaxID=3160969 RepID=UPI0032E83F05
MNCPICKSQFITYFHRYSQFNLLQCSNCELVFQEGLSNINTKKFIPEIYNEAWLSMREPYKESTFVEFALFNITLIQQFHATKGNLLEIGSGTGEFLYAAQAAGWNVSGLEPSATSCQYVKENYGIKLNNSMWERSLFPTQPTFNAVAFWHVLEHVPEPITFLQEVHSVLYEDGLLFFSVPNHHSFTNEICGVESLLYTEVDHLFHYSSDNLPLLLEQASFEPITIFSRQAPHRIHMDINLSLQKSDRYKEISIPQKMALIPHLQANMRGHELYVVARKKTDVKPNATK